MTNKTLEGYPGNRFHGGGQFIDVVEQAAIDRAKTLFGAAYVNVQPHSGTQANQAVFFRLLRPGDCWRAASPASASRVRGSSANVRWKKGGSCPSISSLQLPEWQLSMSS